MYNRKLNKWPAICLFKNWQAESVSYNQRYTYSDILYLLLWMAVTKIKIYWHLSYLRFLTEPIYAYRSYILNNFRRTNICMINCLYNRRLKFQAKANMHLIMPYLVLGAEILWSRISMVNHPLKTEPRYILKALLPIVDIHNTLPAG